MDGKSQLRRLTASILLSVAITAQAAGQARVVETEAISGRPFGVGRVTLSLEGEDRLAGEWPGGQGLSEDDGRALYPVFSPGRVRRLIGSLLGGEQNPFDSLTVYFLFTGEGPLELTLRTPTSQRIIVDPRDRSDGAFDRLQKQWWREYNAVARRHAADDDYPALVETYLTTMLGRRLGLEPPLLSRGGGDSSSRPEQTLNLLMGAETLRIKALESALHARAASTADRPMPEPIGWTPVETDPAAGGEPAAGTIEPIAMRVPIDCFYIRFGKFSNFLWMRKLMTDHGGNLGNMITLRGHDAHLNQRLERQLAMRYSSLAELVGDTLFSDVAMIGHDMFQADGAAIGLLYEAKTPAVKTVFTQERSAALLREKALGAKEEMVKIAGRDVPFLSTPDNQVRSFYASDDKYHLVTTSRAIVERFFACIDAGESLGASSEFRAAREQSPAASEYTIFAYFSRPFFQNLVGPQYKIELERRLRAIADMQALEMARLAGVAEKLPDDSVETLVRAGLLPRGFGWRPEGGEISWVGGRARDSLRGARGYFIPIADLAIAGVTRAEAVAFAEDAEFYQSQWRQMDPLMATVKRFAADHEGSDEEGSDEEGRERIVIDAHASLFAPDKKYGRYLSLLAPASTSHVAPAEGDIVAVQLLMQGGLTDPTIPSHHIYLGLQDKPASIDPGAGGWRESLKILQTAPGYFGAYPRMGLLDWLDLLGVGSAVDEEGYSRLPLGLVRRQSSGFTTLSFDSEVLAQVTDGLAVTESEPPAQVRISAGDLSNAQVTPWVQSLLFDRARRGSQGNARLIHALTEQLRAPVDRAPAIAKSLVAADLVCPLEGEYEMVEDERGRQTWVSSAWPTAEAASYKAPMLEWFRGLDGWLFKEDDALTVHLEVEMQRKKGAPTFGIPLLNLFGGKKDDKKDEKPATPDGESEEDKRGASSSPKQF